MLSPDKVKYHISKLKSLFIDVITFVVDSFFGAVLLNVSIIAILMALCEKFLNVSFRPMLRL